MKNLLKAARSRYLISKAESARAAEEQANDLTFSRDAHIALRRALQIETVATAEYTYALRSFSDLVIHGRMPEDRSKSA